MDHEIPMTSEKEKRVDAFFSALARGLAEDPETRREILLDAGLDPDLVVRKGLALVARLQRGTERVGAPALRPLSIEAVPVKELIKRGVVKRVRDSVDQVNEVLRFFAVSSVPQWQQIWSTAVVRFRRSSSVDAEDAAVAAWLRLGQLQAERVECNAFDRVRFLRVLDEVKSLTREEPRVFLESVTVRCATAGVAVVLVPALPKTGISGATYWLSATKAVIQLSLRYRSDDHFWFTFFHEAGHIILHGQDEIFLEGKDTPPGETDPKEVEANEFASNFLIPHDRFAEFVNEGTYTEASIESFARGVGIAPGIVVGQLQKGKKIGWERFNPLKKKVWFDS